MKALSRLVSKSGQRVHLCLGIFIFLAGLLPTSTTMADPMALHVRTAQVGHDQNGRVAIDLSVTNSQEFARLASENVGRMMELRVDGKTIVSSVIQTEIHGGKFQITGVFSADRARELADQLSKGDAVVQIEIVDQ